MSVEAPSEQAFVSRSGLKLAAALDGFSLDPTGWVCADLGSHVGGFVDCLLQRGAAKVYAVDTAYGTLAWKLRRDPRVATMERTNALHLTLPERVELVTIDVGWTPQHKILPVAIGLLKHSGVIISLIKPHYEAERDDLEKGVLPETKLATTMERMNNRLRELNMEWSKVIDSPLRGHGGNREYLGLIQRAAE